LLAATTMLPSSATVRLRTAGVFGHSTAQHNAGVVRRCFETALRAELVCRCAAGAPTQCAMTHCKTGKSCLRSTQLHSGPLCQLHFSCTTLPICDTADPPAVPTSGTSSQLQAFAVRSHTRMCPVWSPVGQHSTAQHNSLSVTQNTQACSCWHVPTTCRCSVD
jgi:hypothetical protein